MIKVKQFCFNPFGENTYLIYDSGTGDAVVIDPGMWNERERQEFDDYVTDKSLNLRQIINTHLHVDHCFGDNYVRDKYGVKVSAHVGDAPLGNFLSEQASRFGLGGKGVKSVEIDVPLREGDEISVGQYKLRVIHVPGHSPGGIALYCPEGKFVVSGDSLFNGSIGRTDLAGGNHEELVRSVRKKLLTLPDDTKVLPGHAEFTSVKDEKSKNPYLQ